MIITKYYDVARKGAPGTLADIEIERKGGNSTRFFRKKVMILSIFIQVNRV